MSNQVTETQFRTISKLVIYKIMSMIVSYYLSLAFGASTAQAFTMSIIALTLGSLHYYLYDRIWLFIPWKRSEGNDSTVRSLVKTIVYRITVIIVMMITARVVFMDSNWEAFLMAAIKFCTHAATYFTIERVYNRISWGKITKEKK